MGVGMGGAGKKVLGMRDEECEQCDRAAAVAHAQRPLFSVQYHPEASPGPHDASYFFGRFREMVDRHVAGENVTGAEIAKGQSA